MKRALVIGGASSGSGKTTFSIGLMNALSKRGFEVAPFKVGPDYIDPMFHRHVTGVSSYNLPVWMVKDEDIQFLYHNRFKTQNFAVIEGVMGYYDGKFTTGFEGSTAHVAELLQVPAIIIFDASSMSLSAAAIVHGFSTFKENSMIKGVVLNNVASDMHYQLLKTGIENFTNVKCYGYLKRDSKIALGSRHLGLLQAEEIEDLDQKIEYITEQIEATIDLEGIIADFVVTAFDDFSKFDENLLKLKLLKDKVLEIGGLNIGIAQDKAFSFYYDENIETLKEIGVNLIPFSPLQDDFIPECDGVYIGGGYPEIFSKEISDNQRFLADLNAKLSRGLPCYAECGGLMFLTNSIEFNDVVYPMVGFFNAKSKMTSKLQRFGMTEVLLENFLGYDISFRAHEFHKSKIDDLDPLVKKYKVSKGSMTWKCGYQNQNTLATYSHHHFYSNINFLELLIDLWGIRKNRI